MNEHLKIFLTSFCTADCVSKGEMIFSCEPGKVFDMARRWYDDSLPRDDSNLIVLTILVSSKGLRLQLFTDNADIGEVDLNIVNSTVAKIEEWVISLVGFDFAKPK